VSAKEKKALTPMIFTHRLDVIVKMSCYDVKVSGSPNSTMLLRDMSLQGPRTCTNVIFALSTQVYTVFFFLCRC